MRRFHVWASPQTSGASKNAMDPSDRMIRLYNHLLDQIGEAADIIEYDETTASNPTHLQFIHIAIWDAKLAPALSEIALKPFPLPDSEVKVLHIYPLTHLETHMVADHGREEFVEFIEERKIDLFSDRSD
jgi:hypothetical protein